MNNTTRREFLQQAGLGLTVSTAVAQPALASPNERVHLGIIGVRGMGYGHLQSFLKAPDAAVVTVCDVDESILARAGETVKSIADRDVNKVSDFRRVLDDKSIDAVVIATPHHWHAPMALRAMQAGKDVYFEKPASHVFREGRIIANAAKKYGRVVQHGTQMRSSEVTRKAAEVIQSGILGEIKTTKAWNVQKHRHPEPIPDEAVPEGVDYEMWLGPATLRPFNQHRFHGYWAWMREYGNGDIGNDGAHDIDMARFGLGVTTHPIRITAHGSRIALKGRIER